MGLFRYAKVAPPFQLIPVPTYLDLQILAPCLTGIVVLFSHPGDLCPRRRRENIGIGAWTILNDLLVRYNGEHSQSMLGRHLLELDTGQLLAMSQNEETADRKPHTERW